MIDFRYHIVTTVAVFLALGIGLLLGVTVADNIVSGAEKDLERSLKEDLDQARSDRSDALKDLRLRDDFEQQTYASVVDGALIGRRIGIFSIGETDGTFNEQIRDAIAPSGGAVKVVAAFKSPVDIDRLSEELSKTKYRDLKRSAEAQSQFAEQTGKELITGGKLLKETDQTLLSTRSGSLARLDAIIYFRGKRDLKGFGKRQTDRFESGLLKGLTGEEVPVVGVEDSDTEPSQISYYSDHDLASVDDLEIVPGRVALVYALAGAKGQFGIKSSATQLLPQTSENPAR